MRILSILFSALIAVLPAFGQSTNEQPTNNSIPGDSIAFAPLTNPQRDIIENLLRAAREWARTRTGGDLDGSEGSIANLDAVLASTASWLKTPGLDLVQRRTEGSCLAYGIYLGQMFVDRLQAEWGTTRANAEMSVEFVVRTRGARHILLYPIRRVCSRITEGPQYNVIDYYKAGVSAAEAAQ